MTRRTLCLLCALCVAAMMTPPQAQFRPDIPRVWDDAALADWATPLVGLNARPTHLSSREYYALPVDNLRTYPVYFPGNEPPGYWETLQRIGPQPMTEPETLRTEGDWIEAGRGIFHEDDQIHMRTLEPAFIALARSREALEQSRTRPAPDGTVTGMRWVPTANGVALGFVNCGFCHTRNQPGGLTIVGAPFRTVVPRPPERVAGVAPIVQVQMARRITTGAAPFFMGQGALGTWLYQASRVPWITDDSHERLKTLSRQDTDDLDAAFKMSGGTFRWNGSPFYPAKIPDLIGLKDRKYIDHTPTHLHPGIGDVMRYAALVSVAETVDFGPHHAFAPDARRAGARLSDEALYALTCYIYSLESPPNPNPFDEQAQAGQRLFAREGCVPCHTPPVYTNNKLTLALGFIPPADTPASLDILRVSVGTDPNLALKTRKGTGWYKVPSLKGVWYRGHYLHDGSAASLEEMFDPERVNGTHVAEGWRAA